MPMRIGVYGRMPFLGGLVSSEEDSFVPSGHLLAESRRRVVQVGLDASRVGGNPR